MRVGMRLKSYALAYLGFKLARFAHVRYHRTECGMHAMLTHIAERDEPRLTLVPSTNRTHLRLSMSVSLPVAASSG
jgi:hypothetical protein